MHRCIQLAKLGAGYVAPNPMVGAVLVHENRIIGEGYHQKYGEAHAEVNCINEATAKGHADFFTQSILYVSLEPCSHFGKTPPCADLIIKHGIPKVVVGCRDPFKEVDGKGIEKLRKAGVEVELGVLEKDCADLNKRFFTFHTKHRPYIILKWAQTADGFMATSPLTPLQRRGEPGDPVQERLFISNEYTNRLVHRWRSEEASILVGTNTVEMDDPQLTTRLWPGPSPIRLIVDMQLRLASSHKVFDGKQKTIICNSLKHDEETNPMYYQVTEDVSLVHQIVHALYQMKIQSVMVEGGARLLQSFIDEEMWDESRVISNNRLTIGRGLPAPAMTSFIIRKEQTISTDVVKVYEQG